ncbi:peroxidase-like [Cydia splendana]|uniref:peroxidase-like n=1 Tax=Cydia splendana TaxID=1100963 RepID=UPI00300C94EE
MYKFLWVLLTVSSLEARKVSFHTFYETVLTKEEILQQAKANTTFWCSSEIELPCDPNEFRRLDGSCNNLDHPAIGAAHTPFVRLLPPEFGNGFEPKPAQDGGPEPPARHIRTTLIANGIRPDPIFTILATHFFVFMAADTVSIQDTVNYVVWKPYCCQPKGKTDPMCTPVQVPNDDPVHRFSDIRCLNLTRPTTYQFVGCTRNGTVPERISSAMPLFDLSIMYGNSLQNALKKGRLYYRGLLKYEMVDGRMLPPSTRTVPNICLLNQPPHETRCHATPEDGMNSLLGINLIGIWFWRNHNRIASGLAELNPCWNDDKIFYTARDINIATYVQILYYEFLPPLFGWSNLKENSVVSKSQGFRDMYNPEVMPTISLEFPYILRWAHLMQEGRVKMYDEAGHYLKQMPIVNLTLRTGSLVLDNNLDGMTQGCFRQPSGKLDYTIDPDIGELILGGLQRASDVGSSDLEKGRYNNFPPYIEYIKYCTGQCIETFDDLVDLIDTDKLDLLQELYQHVRDIDLLAGTWVEKPIEGGFVPPTFYCIVVDQLIRSMVSDRHWYERPNRPNAFTLEQLLEIRKASISRVLCDVGDTVTRIQRRGFERAGPENRMVSCKSIEQIDLTAWEDYSCSS